MVTKTKLIPLHSYFVAILLLCSVVSFAQKKGKKGTSYEEKLKNTSLFIDANKEKALGNYEKATELLRECVANDPNNDGILYELANMLFNQENNSDALIFVQRAIKINPENYWYNMLLSSIYQQMGNYEELIKLYKSLTKTHPNKIELHYDWATACIFSKDMKQAVKVYNIIEEIVGIEEGLSIAKKNIYISMNKPQSAINELLALSAAFPEEVQYYNLLAELYENTGNFTEAKKMYDNIQEKEPENEYLHLSLSEFYRKQGDMDKSFKELEKAFGDKHLIIDSKMKILLYYFEIAGRDSLYKKRTYSLLETLIKTHPNEAKSHSIYADFLYRDKRLKESRDEFARVLELDSSKYIVWETIMIIDSELENFEALVQLADKAIQLFPEQPLLYLFGGAAAFETKDYEKATVILNKGAEITISNTSLLIQFYSYIGDAYYKLEDMEKADMAYEQVLSLDSNNSYVLNNYSYFLSLRGEQLDKAYKMAKKVAELNPNSASYLDTYAWVLYKMKNYQLAKETIDKAMQHGGEDSDVILEHYGDILYKLNSKEEAYNYWKKAKEKGKGTEFLEKKLKDKALHE